MLNLLVEQPAAVTYHLHLPSLPTDYVNKPIKTFKSAKPRPLSHKNKEIINLLPLRKPLFQSGNLLPLLMLKRDRLPLAKRNHQSLSTSSRINPKKTRRRLR